MAQNENYSQVDLRIGTEEQFNAKVGTLPAGTLFGITDSTVSKADLSTDLKNEINGKINKPANPTSDSAVVISSSGTISTKPLTSITGKSEVAVQSTTPTGDEILWINPNGTSGGGGSSGGVQFVEVYGGRPLTEEQLTTLKANKSNQIIYYGGVKYYFKLAYEKSSTEWVYATFVDSATTLTVNMTTGSATFDIANGGKLYRHKISIIGKDSSGTSVLFIYGKTYSTSMSKITVNDFWKGTDVGAYNIYDENRSAYWKYEILSESSKVLELYITKVDGENVKYSTNKTIKNGLNITLTDTVKEV